MPRYRELTEEEQALVRKLFAEKKGRNRISKETGIPPASVSRFCKENGLTFRTPKQLDEGRRAHQENMREIRAELARDIIEAARDNLKRARAKTYKYYERNRNDELVLVEMPAIPIRELDAFMRMAETASRTHLSLIDTLEEKGSEEEKTMLDLIRGQMKEQVAEWDEEAEGA